MSSSTSGRRRWHPAAPRGGTGGAPQRGDGTGGGEPVGAAAARVMGSLSGRWHLWDGEAPGDGDAVVGEDALGGDVAGSGNLWGRRGYTRGGDWRAGARWWRVKELGAGRCARVW